MAGGRHKYRAKRTICVEGHSHPSRAEARRCDELHLLQRLGKITRLEYEPQFWFYINGKPVVHGNGRRVGYKPDWRYFENDEPIAEEYKGFRTEAYVLKLAFFKAVFPDIEHRETGRG